MSSGLYSGVSGIALGSGLYRNVSGLWGGASGLVAGFGGGSPYGGASLYLDFLSMTAPTFDNRITFTRGSNATLTDSTGKITYAPSNLLTYSQEFDNAAWVKSNTTVTANAAVAPDGTSTADKLVENTANSSHMVEATSSVLSGTVYATSIYVKAAGRTSFSFRTNTDASLATFDLATGTVGVATNATASMTAVGSGWYRCALVWTATSSASVVALRVRMLDGAGNSTYTGDGTSGVYLWGAQLEPVTYQTTPGTYVATTSSAYYGPRFDYDPVTLAAKGLLIEEARTNLLTYSNGVSNAAWAKTNITVTAAATTSPDGTVNAQKLAATATAPTNLYVVVAATATSAAYSIYVKQGTGATTANTFGLRNSTTATNLVLGTINYATGAWTYTTGSTGVTVSNAGNGWWRLQIAATAGITAGDSLVAYCGFIGPSETAGNFLYAYGAQLEAGAFATSYIPTVASTVTRSADVATMTGTNFSSWYNQSAGAFVVAASDPAVSAAANIFTVDDTTTQERIRLLTDVADPKMIVTDGNVTQANLDAGAVTANTPFVFSGAYKLNDFAAVVNGGTVVTDAAGTIPTVTTGRLGADSVGNYLNGHIRSIAYFNTRLPDAQLQTLTAPSAVTTLSLDFTSGSYTVGY